MSVAVTPERAPEKKQDTRDIVLAALVGIVLTPFDGMVHALVYRLMWSWFLAPQYGEGPTLRTWFGISVLYGMFFTIRDAQKEPANNKPTSALSVIESVITSEALLGIMLVAAVLIRFVWGWR